ncbi:MAG: DUF2452 domain-containing protein [Bacteroidia bacterium]|nr:DUF2452 domain-containing protein [Bacteroidia bacterium]
MEHNPIDPSKTAAQPGLLPYPHTVGSVQITPLDLGKVKGKALLAMQQQTQMQLDQIRRQIELLAEQAQAIRSRAEISEVIYEAETQFEPLIGQTCYVYERRNGRRLLSMVAPEEWGPALPYRGFIAEVRLLADHTWEVVRLGDLPIQYPENQ